MTNKMFGSIRSIVDWFKQAKPSFTHSDFQIQLGVHFEEISEMCDAMVGADPRTAAMIVNVREQTHFLAERLKTAGEDVRVMITPDQRIEFLDACCDQIVTATGSAHMANMFIDGATEEVDRSNWSKFVDGKAIFDEDGKISKGPDYFKADLEKFV